ncbi:uncharacterized protein LOC100826416 isoform X2 [Brachypodium distachyon]|uniref:Uncharacterized protein n=1 Tax=Brachypodium distachyon TaxID=15368 RepID=A0A2K2DJG0_BRADI|nr:uncharacterized protein LOC100826416 isoform X2 [Brachypodium distachyon]PNT74418.1 hypothetical protein BRADI_1g14486v3 [Brachypodium distachyon]PNT74419.1 hypothetical protein BRADI_1g14486v3 [Brachypodium distachyon]|eukprot:XP_003562270.1 uncharacterized protein LOC100826416 isoform X2 [Brachypodium distachyon]
MSWRGVASRSLLSAVRGRTASTAPRLSASPLPSAPRGRIPAFSSPFATARPLAAMMGSPAAVVASLTGHCAASVRACCELSQGKNGKDG